jgi:hypothetical protein
MPIIVIVAEAPAYQNFNQPASGLVCHNKRINQYRVFRNLAAWGKPSVGRISSF